MVHDKDEFRRRILLAVCLAVLFDMSMTLLISKEIGIEWERNAIVKYLVITENWGFLASYGVMYLLSFFWKEMIERKRYLFEKGNPRLNYIAMSTICLFWLLFVSYLIYVPLHGGFSWIVLYFSI